MTTTTARLEEPAQIRDPRLALRVASALRRRESCPHVLDREVGWCDDQSSACEDGAVRCNVFLSGAEGERRLGMEAYFDGLARGERGSWDSWDRFLWRRTYAFVSSIAEDGEDDGFYISNDNRVVGGLRETGLGSLCKMGGGWQLVWITSPWEIQMQRVGILRTGCRSCWSRGLNVYLLASGFGWS